MEAFDDLLMLLPAKMVQAVERHRGFRPEEMRFRIGRAPSLVYGGREHFLPIEKVSEDDLLLILQKATGASLYSAAQAIRQGYYCTGGLRVGVCGQTAPDGRGTGFARYSSLCVRLARECRGVCGTIAAKLNGASFPNTLILSPPGGGKTTALRDVIRCLSDSGRRIGVIDERGELSANVYDLGRCSDVISGLDKLTGALLLLRSMTPEIIAADEITSPEDIQAMEEVYGCGTGLIATAHAKDIEDLTGRKGYRRLIDGGVFRNAVLIQMKDGKRHYEIRSLA